MIVMCSNYEREREREKREREERESMNFKFGGECFTKKKKKIGKESGVVRITINFNPRVTIFIINFFS